MDILRRYPIYPSFCLLLYASYLTPVVLLLVVLQRSTIQFNCRYLFYFALWYFRSHHVSRSVWPPRWSTLEQLHLVARTRWEWLPPTKGRADGVGHRSDGHSCGRDGADGRQFGAGRRRVHLEKAAGSAWANLHCIESKNSLNFHFQFVHFHTLFTNFPQFSFYGVEEFAKFAAFRPFIHVVHSMCYMSTSALELMFAVERTVKYTAETRPLHPFQIAYRTAKVCEENRSIFRILIPSMAIWASLFSRSLIKNTCLFSFPSLRTFPNAPTLVYLLSLKIYFVMCIVDFEMITISATYISIEILSIMVNL